MRLIYRFGINSVSQRGEFVNRTILENVVLMRIDPERYLVISHQKRILTYY